MNLVVVVETAEVAGKSVAANAVSTFCHCTFLPLLKCGVLAWRLRHHESQWYQNAEWRHGRGGRANPDRGGERRKGGDERNQHELYILKGGQKT